MKLVRYIDTYCSGMLHEQFNMSLLLMLGMAYDKVECRASNYFISRVKKESVKRNIENIEYSPVFVVSGDSRIALFFRYLISAINSCLFLIFTPSDRIIVYNYNNLFATRLLNWLSKIFHKRVVLFCHGEMELLLPVPREAGYLHKILSYLARDFFMSNKTQIADGLYFSVLGTSIKSNLKNLLTIDKMNHFITIDHAYIFADNVSDFHSFSKKLLHCGTAGGINKTKGADRFVELAYKLELNNRKDICLSITSGVTSYDANILEEAGIVLPKDKRRTALERDELNQRIDQLSYIIFLYSSSSYKLTASGAIMDAISRKRPIIAIRNDYFEYLFGKYGSFGFLVDSVDEMVDLLNRLAKANRVSYPEIDFEKLRIRFAPENIKNELKDSLITIGYL